jgi:hypothetical protein
MHSTIVKNFPESSASQAFANVRITLGEDNHITTCISTKGTSDVTIFFNSPAEIRQFALDLLTQASERSML